MTQQAWRAVAIVWATGGLAFAGEPATTAGRLDGVTVYRQQAAVTRIVPVPGGAGAMEVVVGGLPEKVVPESLHADGGKDVQIRAVRYRQRAVEEAPRGDVRKLDEQAATLEASLREVQQQRDVLTKKQGFLEKLGAFSATSGRGEFEKGLVKTDELSKLTTFVFEQHDQKLLALAEQERKLTEQRALLRRQRDLLTEGRSRAEREAVLFIEKRQAGKAEVRLGYLVEGVGWRPSYNLRAATGKAEVELEYNATIQQMSGEDWQGAKLTLSTATPTLSSDPPSLAPFRVTLDSAQDSKAEHDVVRTERERRAAEEQFRAAASAENREQAEAVANTAAARLNVLYLRGGPRVEEIVPDEEADTASAVAVSYPLDGRHALASRADLQTVNIARLTLKAGFYRLAQPTLTRHVYRQARMTNASDTVLLPGSANGYLDERFAGAGTLPLVRPGQAFTAGFGVDPRLTARHKLLDREESVKGGNKELTLSYEILLENFSDHEIAVRVLDRIPIPTERKIYVSLLKSTVPTSTDKSYVRFQKPRNVLRWDAAVPAHA
ncbi:mucoidy inhibitor MuiA family protein, partial [Planctomycetota bacterium]